MLGCVMYNLLTSSECKAIVELQAPPINLQSRASERPPIAFGTALAETQIAHTSVATRNPATFRIQNSQELRIYGVKAYALP